MEGEGDWSMPSSPCSLEATPEAETEKRKIMALHWPETV